MEETTRITIPKELSDKISCIKRIYPKKKLTKQEWYVFFLNEGLKQYDRQLDKLHFK